MIVTIGFVTSAAPASPSSLLRGNNLIKWAFWVEVGGEEWNSVTQRNCITKMCVSFHCSQYRERERRRRRDICAELGDPIDNTGDISPHS